MHKATSSSSKTFTIKEQSSNGGNGNGNGGQGIPGFPWESIFVGMVLSFSIIFFMRRKRTLAR
jgi:hypothetical protein